MRILLFSLIQIHQHKSVVGTGVANGVTKRVMMYALSNHGSTWQEFQYKLAVGKLSKNGILVSDDIDASPAWSKVSKEILQNPWIIFGARKIIGIAFKKII